MRAPIVLGTLLLAVAAAAAHDGEGPPGVPLRWPRTPAPLPVSPGHDVRRPPAATDGSAARSATATAADWEVWWSRNRDLFIDRTARFAARETPPGDPGAPSSTIPGPPRPLLRESAVEALRAAARSGDKDLASSAIVALGKAGDAASFPLFRDAARDRDRPRDVRHASIFAIGLTGGSSGEAREFLAGLLEDASLETPDRGLAALALGLLGHSGAVPPLVGATRRKEAQADVPVLSAIGLGLLRDDIVVPDLSRWLSGHAGVREPEDLYRAGLAAGLGKLAVPETVPALMKALADRDKDVRRQALLSLGGQVGAGDEKAVRALLLLLSTENDSLTGSFAALTLGESGSPLAAEALRETYEGADQARVPYAALALGLLARKAPEGPLAERIRGFFAREVADSPNAARTTALAIGAALARVTAAAPALRRILASDAPPEVRAHVALALGMLGDRESIPALREELTGKGHPLVLWDASLALGILGDREAPGILADRVRTGGSQSVRAAAAIAMGFCARLEEADVLVATVGDGSVPDAVRAAAAMGLGLTLDDGPRPALSRLGSRLSPVLPVEALSLALAIL